MRPGKDNATGQGGVRWNGKADTADCASLAAERKQLATLRARLALVGWALTGPGNPDGGFTASRWNRARDLQDLAAVAEFAEMVAP